MEIVRPEYDDEEDEDPGTRRFRQPRKAAPEHVADPWMAQAPGARRSVLRGGVNAKRLVAVLAVAVLAFVGLKAMLPKAAEPEDLSIQFTQGSQTRYRVFVTYKGERTLPSGKSFPLAMNLHATIDLSVESVQGDVATVNVKMTNVYASGPSPFVRQVPGEFATQIQVSKDGAIRSGQLGLANAMIGYLAPGWDLLFPLLPGKAVNEGATWNGSEQVPVTEDVEVPVTASSSLLGILDSGGDASGVSVVTSKITAPVNAEVSMADVASSIGVTPADYGLPVGANPSLSFDGTITMNLTARIDAAAGVVNDMYLKGTADYEVRARGVPGLDHKSATGQVSVDMSVRISKQGIPASPEPATGADREQ